MPVLRKLLICDLVRNSDVNGDYGRTSDFATAPGAVPPVCR